MEIAIAVQFTITILLNCAKDSSCLPVLESADAAQQMLPFIECPIFDVAVLAKIALSFHRVHLTNEQFFYLRLDQEETEHLVSLFANALESLDGRADGNSLEEVMLFLINFTKPEEGRFEDPHEKRPKKSSAFSTLFKNRNSVVQSNIQMSAAFGIFQLIENLLSTQAEENILELCLRLLWNMLQFTDDLPSSLQASISALTSVNSKSAASLVVCIQCLLKNLDASSKSSPADRQHDDKLYATIDLKL